MDILTLDEIKEACQIGHSRQDSILAVVGDSMEGWIKKTCSVSVHTGSSISATTEYCDGGGKLLRVKYHPIVSITSVTDRDSSTAVDSDNIRNNESHIWRVDGAKWSSGASRWTVVYKAGYLKADFPPALKLAMLMLVARWYENRTSNKSSSLMGHSVSWDDLMDSDLQRIIDPYSYQENF